MFALSSLSSHLRRRQSELRSNQMSFTLREETIETQISEKQNALSNMKCAFENQMRMYTYQLKQDKMRARLGVNIEPPKDNDPQKLQAYTAAVTDANNYVASVEAAQTSIFKQNREYMAERDLKALQNTEKRLKQSIARNNEELEMVNQQLEATSKGIDGSIKDLLPRFAA